MNLKWLPALALATQLHASTIDLGLDRTSHFEGFEFNELNGATSGHVSLNLVFNNSVTIFSNTSNNFEVGLTFQTSDPQFITGTGFLLDQNGNPLCGVRPLASATSDDGFIFVGLYPMYADETGLVATDLSKPIDFYGVQFDLTLPGATIQDGSFWVTTPNYAGGFRIGANVPEGGMTLTLLVIALIIILPFYDSKTTR